MCPPGFAGRPLPTIQYAPARLAEQARDLVASPRLFEPECKTPRQMKLANALCRFTEMAIRVTPANPLSSFTGGASAGA